MKQQIKKCGIKPNCVSTENSEQDENYIAQVRLEKNPLAKLAKIFKNLKFEIIKEESFYIHGVATSRFFKFKDDIEFLYDEESKVLKFRSESRKGYSDLGVNRKRIEKILRLLEV